MRMVVCAPVCSWVLFGILGLSQGVFFGGGGPLGDQAPGGQPPTPPQ